MMARFLTQQIDLAVVFVLLTFVVCLAGYRKSTQ
jgi:hypothetical protein